MPCVVISQYVINFTRVTVHISAHIVVCSKRLTCFFWIAFVHTIQAQKYTRCCTRCSARDHEESGQIDCMNIQVSLAMYLEIGLSEAVSIKMPPGGGNVQALMSCLASAISTESPSWFNESSPDSGTSPEVLCDTAIFLAISCRQVICELPL